MATPLTDSINALTTYANEVTGESDTTLSDAVHTLASGYGQGGTNYLNYVSRLGYIFVSSAILPQKIEFSPVELASGDNNGYFLTRAYESGKSSATIDLIVHFEQTTPFSLRAFLYQAYGVKTVKITGNLQYCTSYQSLMDYGGDIRVLDMVFDFSSVTSDAGMNLCASGGDNSHITNMRFAPNTASYNLNLIKFTAIDDSSIVSAANCLATGVTGKTLTLYATQKARCSTLMGTNDNGTFVIDPNGTISLADFITNVKGWTLN